MIDTNPLCLIKIENTNENIDNIYKHVISNPDVSG